MEAWQVSSAWEQVNNLVKRFIWKDWGWEEIKKLENGTFSYGGQTKKRVPIFMEEMTL